MLDFTRAMLRSLQTRLFAAVLLLPLVALATATSGIGLRCRITGEVLDACCCGHAAEDSANARPTTVSAAGCCDRVVRDVTATAAEASAPLQLLPEPATPMPAFTADVSRLVADTAQVRARPESRASLGPPTVRLRLLAKSTFLI